MAIPPTPIYQRNITTFDNLAVQIELGRRIILVRHGERVDRCFQKYTGDWLHRMWPSKTNGIYVRANLNMPRRCPLRGGRSDDYNLLDYKSDAPLTTVGEGTAERLGSRIYGSNLKIHRIYCSPALRCMQTCNRVIQGYCEAAGPSAVKARFQMNIEPAIFDFTGFVESQLFIPAMLPSNFMVDRGFVINKDYKPLYMIEKLVSSEEIEQFTARMEKAVEKILKDSESDHRASILVVTHGPVMDAICQILLGQPPRPLSLFPKVANYPPYLATMVMEENVSPKSHLKWRLAPPPIKSFTIAANNHRENPFDWRKLTERR